MSADASWLTGWYPSSALLRAIKRTALNDELAIVNLADRVSDGILIVATSCHGDGGGIA